MANHQDDLSIYEAFKNSPTAVMAAWRSNVSVTAWTRLCVAELTKFSRN
jgi:hypothetical protein